MSPARVLDQQLGATPEHPFMRYLAQAQCSEPGCEDWQVTLTADVPLAHLANLEDLEDMALEHNARRHDGAAPGRRADYRPHTA